MSYFNCDTGFSRITSDQLRAALDDPRLPQSFLIEAAHNYPALVIRTAEIEDGIPDAGAWYIGYIDLFDGTYHPRPKGCKDTINPTYYLDEDGNTDIRHVHNPPEPVLS